LLGEYQRCLIVGADNVTSNQFHQIRISLRDKATIIMGKNTMMRKVIKGYTTNNPDVERYFFRQQSTLNF